MSSASPQFRGYDDYYVPLLRLLAALPGGKGRTREVQDEFWRCHQSRIPPEHRVIIRDGKEEKWRNVLDWSRNEAQEARPARYAPVRLLADIAGRSGLAQSEPGRDTPG